MTYISQYPNGVFFQSSIFNGLYFNGFYTSTAGYFNVHIFQLLMRGGSSLRVTTLLGFGLGSSKRFQILSGMGTMFRIRIQKNQKFFAGSHPNPNNLVSGSELPPLTSVANPNPYPNQRESKTFCWIRIRTT
jgi:hypothetical protein